MFYNKTKTNNPLPAMLKTIKFRTVNQIIPVLILIALVSLMNSCFYYKVAKVQPSAESAIPKLQEENNYFILHYQDQVWHFTNIITDEDSLCGDISGLIGHQKYLTTNPSALNQYSKRDKINEEGIIKDEREVLNEVHIYISGYSQITDKHISIPVSSIDKIDVYDPAKGASAASIIVPTVLGGAAVGGALFYLLISAAFNNSSADCSCPLIEAFNGDEYAFTGDIFSGAIRPGLERDDFLPLPALVGYEEEYRLKMANKDHEIQYINLAELIVVDHPEYLSVLMDKYGKLHTYRELVAPVDAENCTGRDILPLINRKDTLSYAGDGEAESGANEAIVMKFIRPRNSLSAKLVIRAKNTIWLEYLYAKYHSLLGDKYDEFSKKQEAVSPGEQMKWALNQNFPLSIYAEKNGKWEFLDYYNIAGPKAFKDDILYISLDGVDSDTVKIKLGYGFLFWEIDYLGMDFSADVPVKIYTITVKNAVDEKGANLTDLLSYADNEYYIQNETGNEALLSFNIPELSENHRTVLLHSKGHYYIMRDQQGKPDRQLLRTFRKPGRFPAYSREMFDQLQANLP
jgi:hypothetical protein